MRRLNSKMKDITVRGCGMTGWTGHSPGRLLPAALAALVLVGAAPLVGSADCWQITADTTVSQDRTESCIDVARGCTLTISGCTLTLDGSNGDSTSTINGTVVLADSSSTLRIKTNDHTMTGTGSIIGEHNSATIDDHPVNPGGLTLASGLTIRGALRIALDLVNNGTVLADDGTTEGSRDRLLLDSGEYTGSGLFEVTRAIGLNPVYLEFDATGVTATGLATGFTVSANGTLDCETTVTTSKAASLSFTGGTIIADAGVTVTFN